MAFLSNLRKFFQNKLSDKQRMNIRNFQALRFRGLQRVICKVLFGSNIKALAFIYGTDKWGSHWYAQHYETHFALLRRKKLNVLEIGVGGSKDELGGASLRMWRTYFPKSNLFGIDIYDKSANNERRIKTLSGSQVDDGFLERVVENIGKIDIIIDDGSHRNDHVLHTFKFLFPKMSENGIYVIEDTLTSYWPHYGGSSEDLNRLDTTMGFLKQLTDGLNYCEYRIKDYKPSYFDKNIVAIHFYHNIVFIQKGLNNEVSTTGRGCPVVNSMLK